jgi:hypothetical protein
MKLYELQKDLPDGRLVGVAELTFGRGRIVIGDAICVHNSW